VYFLAPLLIYLVVLLAIYNFRPGEGFRKACLRSAVLTGTYAILVTELLTLFHAVTTTNLIIAWVVPAPLLSYTLLKRFRRGQRISLPSFAKPNGRVEIALWLGIVVILLTTTFVAWKSPPQTWDSLNYHMSRVAHWAQQAGLQHFATGIEVQNNMAPGAEILVLQSYLLSASDKWVNFIQLLAMIGSAVGASWIAHQLGAGRRGSLLTAVFVFTIPMGIAESTSTMTDYVVSFWAICAAAESLEIIRGKTSAVGVGILAAAVGLAILTKPTAYAFLSPVALIVGLKLIKRLPFKQVMQSAVFVVTIVLILNLGHFARNTVTYANPIGPEDRFDQHANQLRSLRGLTTNLLRNTAMHLQTPSSHVNKAVAIGVNWVHELMGLDVNDPRTTAAGKFKVSLPRTNEILVGNLLHATLILILLGMITWRRKSLKSEVVVYAGSLIFAALLFSFLFKWLIFGTRLQLPFFVLAAPLFGIVFGDKRIVGIGTLLGFILLIGSIPWVVSIDSRPIIPIENRSTVGSVATESWLDLLFANGDYLKEPSRDVVIKIEEAGCTDVGLMLAGNSVEYTFWTMLGAPRSRFQFEWIVEGTPSAKYSSARFDPCAIICENCFVEGEMFRGLKLVHSRAPYRLYLAEPDPVQ
jgi:hypothetical protein